MRASSARGHRKNIRTMAAPRTPFTCTTGALLFRRAAFFSLSSSSAYACINGINESSARTKRERISCGDFHCRDIFQTRELASRNPHTNTHARVRPLWSCVFFVLSKKHFPRAHVIYDDFQPNLFAIVCRLPGMINSLGVWKFIWDKSVPATKKKKTLKLAPNNHKVDKIMTG